MRPGAVREELRLAGLITAVIGIAMMIFLKGVEHNNPEPDYLVGLLAFLLGAGPPSYTYLLAPKKEGTESTVSLEKHICRVQ